MENTRSIAIQVIGKILSEKKDALHQIEKLEADKEELLEALEGIERLCDNENPSHEIFWRISYSLLQKHKQCGTA